MEEYLRYIKLKQQIRNINEEIQEFLSQHNSKYYRLILSIDENLDPMDFHLPYPDSNLDLKLLYDQVGVLSDKKMKMESESFKNFL